MKPLYIFLAFSFVVTNLYGQKLQEPNPKAPEELSQFQFLVGKWDVVGKTKQPDGTIQEWPAKWEGYYTYDGYIFADDFTVNDPEGNLIFGGVTYRIFNKAENKWKMSFLDAANAVWNRVFEGVMENGEMKLDYRDKDQNGEFISIITFGDISETSFTWSINKSYDNGNTWIENETVMVASRID